MKRRHSGELVRSLRQWKSGHKLGFVYDEASAEKALELADRIIAGDMTAWDELDLRHDLLTNVAANLRSEGEIELADRVVSMQLDLNESRYIETQEKTMRIRGSELRKIIKEELKRSMMKEEAAKTVLKGKATNPKWASQYGVNVGEPVKGIFVKSAAGEITFETSDDNTFKTTDLLSRVPTGIDELKSGEYDASYTLTNDEGIYTIEINEPV